MANPRRVRKWYLPLPLSPLYLFFFSSLKLKKSYKKVKRIKINVYYTAPKKKRVPKGTSAYQASWIVDEDEEDQNGEGEEDEDGDDAMQDA